MFVKEEEAKTKLCPLSFNRPVADPTRDTGGLHTWDPPWVCKGSECMAWRPSVMSPYGEVWGYHSERDRNKTVEMNPNDGFVKGGVCGFSAGRIT